MSTSTTPTFIPSTEELNNLQRDLSFHPASTENPVALTREQIAAFNRDGYLKGIRIFEKNEITEIRGYFDELLAKTVGGRRRQLLHQHRASPIRPGLRYSDAPTDCGHHQGSARRKCDRLGLAFLLQNAGGWQAGCLASGFQLLAANTVDGCDGVAGDRRC